MTTSTLHIKNMVCDRCIMVVENELQNLGYVVEQISLGKAVVQGILETAAKDKIDEQLQKLGFVLIEDKKQRWVEQVKNLIIAMVHHQDDAFIKFNLSEYLSNELHLDYSYISSFFSEIENTTIEKYFISQKTERIKELISYNELTLSEIAFKMHYSSIAHLSNQFKKVTGLSPTQYKHQLAQSRKAIDKI